MANPDSNLKIINVMDPVMCLRCTSAHIAEVLFTDGSTKKMFYCSRLDCDNWCEAQAGANCTTDGVDQQEAA